ncbi:MraY family glycosyltransferase [Pseudomonas anguilliseptica]|uniref:MraY family glycosyltransferase n=1 Tax=Pseudomonas anguilliseptica TaxID=53406 RepID=UPI001F3F0E43|nr:glycosyltransferase family 4 protein [Pseudomonas anguilliseptica]MCE5362879.1 glycosyltransferase family 4 protein [Pseudomonas anguilliseptica]
MIIAGLCIITLIAVFLVTGLLRRYALSRSLIDIPNSRSSHSVPTPRGGGVAIVVCFLSVLVLLFYLEYLDLGLFVALLGAGLGVAILGFLDDHGHIAARWRLLGHFISAGWILCFIKGLPPVLILGSSYDLMWFGYVVAAFYIVWMLNLYNFMDGIDGIASVEAISVCVGIAFIYYCSGHPEHVVVPLVLAAAVGGFLIWNFPPAKIFMGDAGSGFLGVTLACLSLYSGWLSAAFMWSWLILLGVFVVDATWTLFCRLFRGEALYEAHRSHAYQIASRRYGRHLPVTIAVFLINVLWLTPWALAVATGRVDGMLALLLAYFPLLMLAIHFGAGQRERLV